MLPQCKVIIEDMCKDLNYSSTDISFFSETRFTNSDNNSIYTIDGYSLLRNDGQSNNTTRPFAGTVVYNRIHSILVILTVLIGMVLR